MSDPEAVFLTTEEREALLGVIDASDNWGSSQPAVWALVESARRKLAGQITQTEPPR